MRANAGKWPLNAPDGKISMPPNLEKYGPAQRQEIARQNILARDFKDGQMSRDQTLFVDTDGKAYHIYTSEENSTIHIALLNEDYTDHSGTYTRVFPLRWMEAPAICKRKGIYYFIASGCSGWKPNAARSAVAESIFGPWTELGNPCIGINPLNERRFTEA